MRLVYTDPASDPAAWAARWGTSLEAAQLLAEAHFIDLHLDLEVPVRLYGYDPSVRHEPRRRPAIFFGHTDYPRLREASFSGVVYDVATNPFRPAANRQATTLTNLERVKGRVARHADELAIVTCLSEYDAARAAGKLAFFLSLQGGNALVHDPSVLQGEAGRLLHRITLVHLTSSPLGGTSSPLGRDRGISELGRAFVTACNAAHVLVDLAHAGKRTFWGALDAHSLDLPPIVSHTGVSGVYPHWRNLDDDQIRAIADRGGVVGIMYQSSFLAPAWIYARRSAILDHLEHVCRVGGEACAAIGTDYDGMIVPPGDLPDVTAHPLLVQDMLDRGWSERRIRGILGENYLRVVRHIRP